MLTGQIMLQLIIILIVVQIFGYLCRRLGQQWVIGEIVAGLVLGPSLLGTLLPGVEHFVFAPSTLPTLQTLGDLGLLLYMFALGARLDTNHMLRQSRKALIVSLSGIVFPLALGIGLAFFLFPTYAGPAASQLSFMLMLGIALAITAFPVLARLLVEKGMTGLRIGTLALTCAAFGDVIAWFLLAFVIAITQAKGLFSTVLVFVLIVLFVVVMLTGVRLLLAYAERHMRSTPLFMTFSLVIVLLAAYATNAIGIHPIFGAFLAGIILPRNVRLMEFMNSIDQVNSLLFLPLYFVFTGLHTQIGLIGTPVLVLIGLLLLVTACVGKIAGSTFAMRFTGERWSDSFSLGILMNTRGLVELIALNIGLELGILSPALFTLLVVVAILTTLMTAPLLWVMGYRGTALGRTGKLVQDALPVHEEA